MNDSELLELAAKAAGYECKWSPDDPFHLHSMHIAPNWQAWNPLTDDGDALRLAVNLGIAVVYQRNAPPELGLPRECAVATGPSRRWFAETGRNENAATRRAIVRAAAEIGWAQEHKESQP